jgi:hypothetical protein
MSRGKLLIFRFFKDIPLTQSELPFGGDAARLRA